MKKFVFSLEKVLSYKEQLLEVLKNEMAVLEAKLHEMEVQIASFQEESAARNRELRARFSQGVQSESVAVFKRYLIEIDQRILKLELQKADLLKVIAAKRVEIVGMNSDISGLDRLRDKQLTEYLSLCRKEQEQMIEEFVGRSRCSAG